MAYREGLRKKREGVNSAGGGKNSAVIIVIVLALLESVAIVAQAILEQALLAHDYVDSK